MDAARCFPGVYFDTVQPATQQVLPRMDIAAFIGFAATGPLHTPVAVEDMARFRDIFGADLPLAWNSRSGHMAVGYLGATVEAFFRNGGHRCWVVRVADEARAHTFAFELPGLLRTDGRTCAPVKLAARSPGSWAGSYRVGTVLQVDQLQPDDTGGHESPPAPVFSIDAKGWSVQVQTAALKIRAGDLVKISDDGADLVLFGFVDEVTARWSGTRLSGANAFWCYNRAAGSPPHAGSTGLRWADWELFPLDGSAVPDAFPSTPTHSLRVQLLRCEIQAWQDDVLTHRIAEVAFHPDHPHFIGGLPADSELYALREGRRQSIPSNEKTLFLGRVEQPRRFPFSAEGAFPDNDWICLPLGMSLLTKSGNTAGPDWASAPADSQTQDGLAEFSSALFLDNAFTGITAAGLADEMEQVRHWRSDRPSPVDLRGIYSLFPVQEATIVAVPDAMHGRWDRNPPEYPTPLTAPSLELVQRLASEDEYLLRWSAVAQATEYLLEHARCADFKNARAYTVRGHVTVVAGETSELLPRPDNSLQLQITPSCEDAHYFRVRAKRFGEVSLWSNTRAKIIPETPFRMCGQAPLELLGLQLTGDAGESPPGRLILRWISMEAEPDALSLADRFELQQADDVEFQSARGCYEGTPPQTDIACPTDGVRYFRVRACIGAAAGPWSNTLRLVPQSLSRLTLQPPEQFSSVDILDVHRALIRLCAARADLMALLSLPAHFRQKEIQAYLGELVPAAAPAAAPYSTVPVLSMGENHVLGYAALYHPWPAIRGTTGGISSRRSRFLPPDGFIAGLMARRTLAHGAWYAPAGVPLEDVVALEPELGKGECADLMQAQINTIHRTSQGFMPLSENTLLYAAFQRAVHIRRLLILLRRLALREGNTCVFEPNGEDFRDHVRHQFEILLEDLHRRGAFAGTTADRAFRVVTDASVNTRQEIDQGRFIVELHVAPSHALKFLRIRLVQSNAGALEVQEL